MTRVPEEAKTIFKTSGASMQLQHHIIVAHKGVFEVGITPINLRRPIRWTHAIIINRGSNAAIFLVKLFRPSDIITDEGPGRFLRKRYPLVPQTRILLCVTGINFCNLHLKR